LINLRFRFGELAPLRGVASWQVGGGIGWPDDIGVIDSRGSRPDLKSCAYRHCWKKIALPKPNSGHGNPFRHSHNAILIDEKAGSGNTIFDPEPSKSLG
jgi:hypothetical protein